MQTKCSDAAASRAHQQQDAFLHLHHQQQQLLLLVHCQHPLAEATTPAADARMCANRVSRGAIDCNVQQRAVTGRQVQLARVVWRLYLHILDCLIPDGLFDTALS